MKKIVFLIGVVFLCLFSCKSIKKHENDLINFTYKINLVEQDILNEDFKKALINYKKIYKIYKRLLTAKNCFTATQLSIIQNDKEQAKNFIVEGMNKGLIPKYYYNDSIINRFIIENNLNDFINEQYLQSKKKYEKNIDKNLNYNINSISNEDNKWKIYYLDSLSRIDKENKDLYYKKYDSIVKEIVEKKLLPIMLMENFSERKLELNCLGCINNENSLNYAFGNNNIKIVLLHYFSFKREKDKIESIKKVVFKGNFCPRKFAEISDYFAKFSNDPDYFYNEWANIQDLEQISKINERRLNIGLTSFQDKDRKFERGKMVCKEKRKGSNKQFIKLFYWCG